MLDELAFMKGNRFQYQLFTFMFWKYLLRLFNVILGAIIGDGDRKSWDSRGPMIWDNFSIFGTNCAILTSWIQARVVGSRVDVVTLRDQLVRVARYSCRFFTAMAGNKAEKKNQGSSVYFNALM